MLKRYLVVVLILTVVSPGRLRWQRRSNADADAIGDIYADGSANQLPQLKLRLQALTEAATPVPAETAQPLQQRRANEAAPPAAGDVFAPSVIAPGVALGSTRIALGGAAAARCRADPGAHFGRMAAADSPGSRTA